MKTTQTKEYTVKEHLQIQLQESRKEIYDLTYFDPLTKLPNRLKLKDLFQTQQNNGDTQKGAVILIDVDRFHSINELHGRDFGNRLLIQIAERLKQISSEENTVFKSGEDEFIIYLQGLAVDEIEGKAKELLRRLSNQFSVDNKTFYITASIGISYYSANGETMPELLNQAEIAMYKVKKSGKNNFQIFLPEDAEVVERKNRLDQDLQTALIKKQLHLVYQPKIDLKSKEVIAVEALLRWDHPELGPISPGEFIPIAEESGVIIDIGYWVIYEAVSQTKAWHDKGYQITTAVNVSALQFNEPHFVSRIMDALNTMNVNPWYLMIEITESVIKNFKYAQSIIHELKKRNIRIAIDDFGTGYSSLSVLKDTYIDVVKIDKTFIDHVPNDRTGSNLVSTMIQMGKDMNFDIIAEGIETIEQSSYLMEHDCKYGQGYLFSKPVLPNGITNYIDRLAF